MDFISPDYKDKYGNRRDNIKAILIKNLMFRKDVKILLRDINVKVEGDFAHLDINLFVKEGNEILPENADFMKFKINLYRVDDLWMITGAEWIGDQSPF